MALSSDPRGWTDDKLERLADAARELLTDGGYLSGPATDELQQRLEDIDAERRRRARFCHESHPAGPATTAQLGATCGRCGGDRARPRNHEPEGHDSWARANGQ